MIAAIRAWRERRRAERGRQRALSTIRDGLVFFGVNVDDLTDEDIERGARELSDIALMNADDAARSLEPLRRAGLTFEESNRMMQQFHAGMVRNWNADVRDNLTILKAP